MENIDDEYEVRVYERRIVKFRVKDHKHIETFGDLENCYDFIDAVKSINKFREKKNPLLEVITGYEIYKNGKLIEKGSGLLCH